MTITLHTISAALAAFAYLWAFWLLYVATMGLYRAHLSGRLSGAARVLAYPLVAFAFAVDLLANWTLAVIVFADPPRERLVTARLKRYVAGPDGWRRRLAVAVCDNLLDPFDPTGNHC